MCYQGDNFKSCLFVRVTNLKFFCVKKLNQQWVRSFERVKCMRMNSVNSWSGVTLVPGAHSLVRDGEPAQTTKIQIQIQNLKYK